MKPKNYGELSGYIRYEIKRHYDKLNYIMVRVETYPKAVAIKRKKNGHWRQMHEAVMIELEVQACMSEWVKDDGNEVLIDFDKGRMMIHTTRNKHEE